MTTNRNTVFLVLAFAAVIFTTSAPAQRNGFGLGLVLGEPTGFSFKGWMDSRTAIDGALAWSFLHSTSFHVHADYLIHTDAPTKRSDMPIYYGIGGRIKAGARGGDRIGVRVVGGLLYYIPDAPIDIFVEIAPILDFAPSTDFQVNGGIGARYFFR